CPIGLILRRNRAFQYARRGRAWLELRITRAVELVIVRDLPLFACEPGQHAAFDRREIPTDEYVSRSCADHRARHIARHCERGAERTDPLHIAAADSIDGGVQIVELHSLQILRLIAATAPPSRARAMEEKAPTQPVIDVDACQ